MVLFNFIGINILKSEHVLVRYTSDLLYYYCANGFVKQAFIYFSSRYISMAVNVILQQRMFYNGRE